MNKEICKCGHKNYMHKFSLLECQGSNFNCTCKKFEAAASRGQEKSKLEWLYHKPKNYCQQEDSPNMDIERELKKDGTFNLSEKIEELKEEIRAYSNWSNHDINFRINGLKEDIKEFIKRLKEEMLNSDDYRKFCLKIDKLSGKDLI